MTIVVIGVDPGKTTGIALLTISDKKIENSRMLQVNWDALVSFLSMASNFHKEKVAVHMVVERFILDPEMARKMGGSDMEVSQVIGACKFWAQTNGAHYFEQLRTVNPIAAKWSGRAIPTNHAKSHQVIAYNHANYYAVQNKLIPHRILQG